MKCNIYIKERQFYSTKNLLSPKIQTKQGRKIALIVLQLKLEGRLKSAYRKALTIPHKNSQKLFQKSFFYWIFWCIVYLVLRPLFREFNTSSKGFSCYRWDVWFLNGPHTRDTKNGTHCCYVWRVTT